MFELEMDNGEILTFKNEQEAMFYLQGGSVEPSQQPQPEAGFTLEMDNGEMVGFNNEQEAMQYLAQQDAAADENRGGAALRGAAQGVSLGFADELSAGLGAGMAKLMGDEKPIKDIYTDIRDSERRKLERDQQLNPVVSTAADIGGALATGGLGASRALGAKAIDTGVGVASTANKSKTTYNALTQAAKSPVASAAAIGGVQGAGYSNKDSLGGVAADVATGAAIGGGVAKGLDMGVKALGAGKGVKYADPAKVQGAKDALRESEEALNMAKADSAVIRQERDQAAEALESAMKTGKFERPISELSRDHAEKTANYLNSKYDIENKQRALQRLQEDTKINPEFKNQTIPSWLERKGGELRKEAAKARALLKKNEVFGEAFDNMPNNIKEFEQSYKRSMSINAKMNRLNKQIAKAQKSGNVSDDLRSQYNALSVEKELADAEMLAKQDVLEALEQRLNYFNQTDKNLLGELDLSSEYSKLSKEVTENTKATEPYRRLSKLQQVREKAYKSGRSQDVLDVFDQEIMHEKALIEGVAKAKIMNSLRNAVKKDPTILTLGADKRPTKTVALAGLASSLAVDIATGGGLSLLSATGVLAPKAFKTLSQSPLLKNNVGKLVRKIEDSTLKMVLNVKEPTLEFMGNRLTELGRLPKKLEPLQPYFDAARQAGGVGAVGALHYQLLNVSPEYRKEMKDELGSKGMSLMFNEKGKKAE